MISGRSLSNACRRRCQHSIKSLWFTFILQETILNGRLYPDSAVLSSRLFGKHFLCFLQELQIFDICPYLPLVKQLQIFEGCWKNSRVLGGSWNWKALSFPLRLIHQSPYQLSHPAQNSIYFTIKCTRFI